MTPYYIIPPAAGIRLCSIRTIMLGMVKELQAHPDPKPTNSQPTSPRLSGCWHGQFLANPVPHCIDGSVLRPIAQ
jgi:hypothetical protein